MKKCKKLDEKKKRKFSFDTKVDRLYELFGLISTKYLKETCKISIPMNKKLGKVMVSHSR